MKCEQLTIHPKLLAKLQEQEFFASRDAAIATAKNKSERDEQDDQSGHDPMKETEDQGISDRRRIIHDHPPMVHADRSPQEYPPHRAGRPSLRRASLTLSR